MVEAAVAPVCEVGEGQLKLSQLTLVAYRNFSNFEVAFDGGAALIVGRNGCGKSNILEAISYLSIGKSIKGTRDRDVVPHDGSHFDIHGAWNDGTRDRRLRVFYSGDDGKRVFVDEAPLPRVSDILSQFQSVHFAPQDVSLVLHFSAQRRRLIDILISQADVSYVRDLQQYQRILNQRNEYLRRYGSTLSAGSEELDVWDQQLSRLGGSLRHKRVETLEALYSDFVRSFRSFADESEEPGLTYCERVVGDGAAELPDEESVREEFGRELVASRQRDCRVKHTTIGPHRDGLTFTLNGESADTFGSQGQLKSLLLSWKLAELRFLQGRCDTQPVLLLDDLFSELDEERSSRVIDMLEGFDQVVLTAPRVPEFARDRFAEICLDG